MNERRRLKRHVERIPARFHSGATRGQGQIKNISKAGVFVKSDNLPEPGAPIHLLFLDREQRKIEVSGTVRWTTKELPEAAPAGVSGFGVLFETPSDDFLAFYEQVLLN